jgi:hypothetical protein
VIETADLVIADLATECVLLRERAAIAKCYREALAVAIDQLAERNRELEAARRRIASLTIELRARRETATV